VLVFRGPPLPRSEPARFSWLQSKRTASLERHLHWRSHGGAAVLLLRSLRRGLRGDLEGWRLGWQRMLKGAVLGWKQFWRARDDR